MSISNQEFFDKTITHFVKQGKRAINIDEGGCAYKTKEGLKCAIGIHIPAKVYRKNMEGMGIDDLCSLWPQVKEYICNDYKLASALQVIHDDPYYWSVSEMMINELTRVALKFNLDTTVLKSLDFTGIS